ncbi:pfyP [Symbiodinium natans]|uniref:PfyP protein n=1 Tax=Symbiodinium natans TaxID=878477 RepID=A0A812MRJ2_9DINO|nr:pfyP [Symbiodinium natans]
MLEDGLIQTSRQTSRPSSRHAAVSRCVDDELLAAVNEAIVSQAFKSAVQDCKFCVTIANPKGEDYPLVAVSKEFETMTGYTRSEILGVNCRFLNQGVDMDPVDLMNLRLASQTGAPFTAVIPNRKKSGELFLNLLDLRGLTVARDRTGEDLWYLIGIQADVSELGEEQMPADHFDELQKLSDFVRERLMRELSTYALSHSEEDGQEVSQYELLPCPLWRPGEPLGNRGNRHLTMSSKDDTNHTLPQTKGAAALSKLKLSLLGVIALGGLAALVLSRPDWSSVFWMVVRCAPLISLAQGAFGPNKRFRTREGYSNTQDGSLVFVRAKHQIPRGPASCRLTHVGQVNGYADDVELSALFINKVSVGGPLVLGRFYPGTNWDIDFRKFTRACLFWTTANLTMCHIDHIVPVFVAKLMHRYEGSAMRAPYEGSAMKAPPMKVTRNAWALRLGLSAGFHVLAFPPETLREYEPNTLKQAMLENVEMQPPAAVLQDPSLAKDHAQHDDAMSESYFARELEEFRGGGMQGPDGNRPLFTFKSGATYKGQWQNNKRHGIGARRSRWF